jgi:hypothetical protein
MLRRVVGCFVRLAGRIIGLCSSPNLNRHCPQRQHQNFGDPACRSPIVQRVVLLSVVARSRQVYIEWLEATVLSVYLPEEKRTSIYVRPTFLATLPPGACVAEPVRAGE